MTLPSADMMFLTDSCSARISSYDTTGRNRDYRVLRGGEQTELARLDGAGCIRHIYFTLAAGPHYFREVVLRMYWDGEATPSVEVPLGDFFGLGHERPRCYQSAMITVNPGQGGCIGTLGLNSFFPMPFANGARITLANEGKEPTQCWFHINYEKLDRLPADLGRFHAQWRRENPTTAVGDDINRADADGVNLDGKENYVIIEAEGHGNLAGYFLNVDNLTREWYGEGDDMIFIDGDTWPPSIHGTGSEEVFGGGACPDSEYIGPYSGYHIVASPTFAGKNAMYRFYIADPVRFKKSIRVTIEHGHANNFSNDYSSTAFWYQSEPHSPFPALPEVSLRYPRNGTDPHDVAFQKLQEFGYLPAFWAPFMGPWAQKLKECGAKLSPEDGAAFQQKLLGPVRQAFEKKDYEKAIHECDAALALLKKYIPEK